MASPARHDFFQWVGEFPTAVFRSSLLRVVAEFLIVVGRITHIARKFGVAAIDDAITTLYWGVRRDSLVCFAMVAKFVESSLLGRGIEDVGVIF